MYSAFMAQTGFLIAGTTTPGASAATAATTDGDDGNGNPAGAIIQLGILLLIPVGMYFLLIRPQRRRMREQQSMQSSIEVGDEILTTAGIYGFITGFDGDRVWVEIDDDVQIRVARAAIQGKVDVPSTSDGTETASDT